MRRINLFVRFVIRAIVLIVSSVAVVPTAAAQLRTEVYASGFGTPIAFVQDPSDRTVQFVVQQGGRIRILKNGVVQATDFLNINASIIFAGEQGLLGMAIAPDYGTSGRFYLHFTNLDGNDVIARFTRSANPMVADPASRFDFRWSDGLRYIARVNANHNGGHLAFGSDGYLYIGFGEGGSGEGPQVNRAQDPQTLLGKMLRIDVSVPDSDPDGYDVPPDNPFLNSSINALPEIWAFGLRNPWRYCFDAVSRGGTGALIVADVGQNAWEEVDYEPMGRGGRNYGWPNREASHPFASGLPVAYTPLTDPIFELGRSTAQSITGGCVYRGPAMGSQYRGRYFFADFVAERIFSIALSVNPSTGEATASDFVDHTPQMGSPGNVASFGLDADGELYVVSFSLGAILKIVRADWTDDPIVAGVTPVRAAHVTELRERIDSVRTMRGLTAFEWTDNPVSVGVTGIRAIHIVEMRQALEAAYLAAELSPPSYTDSPLSAGGILRAVHIQQLRAAVMVLE